MKKIKKEEQQKMQKRKVERMRLVVMNLHSLPLLQESKVLYFY
jgi:hypothetical protein